MKTMTRVVITVVLCTSILSLTGCWDQKIYERIGFILQLGLELNEEGKMLYTVTVPVIEPEGNGKIEILSTTASLVREGREKVRLVSGKAVEGGKTQHVYFSKELAEKGVSDFLQIFLRSTENPLLANVIVVDGSPKELMELSAEFEDKPRPAFYVNDLLIDARDNGFTPQARIYQFIILEHSQTIDPVTPLVRYNEQEIEIAGIALFNGDKMVGDINTAKTALLYLLMGRKNNIRYIYEGQSGKENPEKILNGSALLINSVRRKIEINTEGRFPVVDIKLSFHASLDEYDGPHHLDDPEVLKKIEEEIGQSIQKECLELLHYLQEIDSDPVGFGEMFRAKHNHYWRSIEWNHVYKHITFHLDTKLNIQVYGAIN